MQNSFLTTYPPRLLYWAIGTLAGATLSLQIILTRFFSVVLYYHFAFAGITFALLGMTLAATVVLNNKNYNNIENIPFLFSKHALLFALTSVGIIILFLKLPLLVPAETVTLWEVAAMLFFIVPFYHGGVGITLLLTRLPQTGGRLYAADLVGAALGCMGCVLALFLVDPVTLAFMMAAMVVFVATFIAENRQRLHLWLALVALVGTATLQTVLLQMNAPHLGVRWAKGNVEQNTVYERWNAFSRVDVRCEHSRPRGWGLVHQPEEKIDQCILRIDADADTTITSFKGDLETVSFLKQDVINGAYLLQPVQHTAVIGVGGGRDILSALIFGAKHVTGIEINPSIFEVLTKKFADFSGNLHNRSDVTLVNAEARSYINQQAQNFDLIQISLIDTWAATAAGGLTMTENRLYTTEAWEDFYRALKKGGMLSVSRWFNPQHHTGEFYRLLAIASSALEKIGVPKEALQQHIVALNVGDIVTVITRTTPLTSDEWQAATARYDAAGFKVLLGPDVSYDATTDTLLRGADTEAFYTAQQENIRASTDDKPFFFHSLSLLDVFRGITAGTSNNNAAIVITSWMLLLVTVFFLWYVVRCFLTLRQHYTSATLLTPTLFFTAIGMGFMLVEISQMQRLMVFLGHPVYGLSVVLFTLLLFSGLGSFTVRDGMRRNSILGRGGLLLGALILTGYATPEITTAAKTLNAGMRILLSMGLLAPAAFCMGMMFPLGMGLCRTRYASALPYFWGVNGAASVMASVLGVVLSMEIGITATLSVGIVCYAFCVLALWRMASSRLA
jgi:spermidine synthase